MKREFIYEQRQKAGQMEAIMFITSGVALLAAIFAFFSYGLLPALSFLVLAAVAFAMSRVFDLLDELFAVVGKPVESGKPPPGENMQQPA